MMRLEAGEDEVLERMLLVPTSRASVLLPLSFRKFLLIQFLMSWRQLVREVGGRAVLGLLEM